MLELLVVMTVMALVAVIGLPAFMNTIRRGKIQGTVRETQSLMRAARLQAIKDGGEIGVELRSGEGRIISYRDASGTPDGFDVGTDELLQKVELPNRVSFGGPAADPAAVDGFDGNDFVIFETGGTVNASGAFRIGDPRGNFFEVRIDPPATGRVDIRKWEEFPEGSSSFKWMSQGQQDHSWKWN